MHLFNGEIEMAKKEEARKEDGEKGRGKSKAKK